MMRRPFSSCTPWPGPTANVAHLRRAPPMALAVRSLAALQVRPSSALLTQHRRVWFFPVTICRRSVTVPRTQMKNRNSVLLVFSYTGHGFMVRWSGRHAVSSAGIRYVTPLRSCSNKVVFTGSSAPPLFDGVFPIVETGKLLRIENGPEM
ncbi:hypothetical protein EYF80_059979 [Liparis tanakae]|uniref:Uncharacterized protein n=1 Tax=Liparis tanakae TaxID=230148 RepID=A0A4Z2ENB6_9TELE|nr:hypothetical protein EYF80_059979 [Liparis tanakae]